MMVRPSLDSENGDMLKFYRWANLNAITRGNVDVG